MQHQAKYYYSYEQIVGDQLCCEAINFFLLDIVLWAKGLECFPLCSTSHSIKTPSKLGESNLTLRTQVF